MTQSINLPTGHWLGLEFSSILSLKISPGRRSWWTRRAWCRIRWPSGQPDRPPTRWAPPSSAQWERPPGWLCRKRWWSRWRPTWNNKPVLDTGNAMQKQLWPNIKRPQRYCELGIRMRSWKASLSTVCLFWILKNSLLLFSTDLSVLQSAKSRKMTV